jgi:hypothetical protein
MLVQVFFGHLGSAFGACGQGPFLVRELLMSGVGNFFFNGLRIHNLMTFSVSLFLVVFHDGPRRYFLAITA